MSEANLTNFKIKDSYEGLLHIDGDLSTVATTVKRVYDGRGKSTCLTVAQKRMWVDGDLRIGPNNGSGTPYVYITGDRTGTIDTLKLFGNDRIEFETNNYDSPTTRMTVNTTGVGIGTTTPAKTLHVNGSLRLKVGGTEANKKVLTCINTSGDCEWQDSGAGDMEEIVNAIYPIGAIYISVNSANPNTLFNNTSWTRIANGKFLVSRGTSPADKNGESRFFATRADTGKGTAGTYSHTLTREETPSVKGGISIDGFINTFGFAFTNSGSPNKYLQNAANSPNGNVANFDNGGKDKKHNNTPPWFGAYIWERVS